ncbi:MAG: hypothetical protein AAFQ50_00855 [Pseudomonadota bacterium]
MLARALSLPALRARLPRRRVRFGFRTASRRRKAAALLCLAGSLFVLLGALDRPVASMATPPHIAAAPPTSATAVEQTVAATSAPACDIVLQARPAPAAFLDVEISAPCAANQTARVRSTRTTFLVPLDADGAAKATLPALSPETTLTVEVEGATPTSTLLAAPDYDQYNRAVLQWQGPAAFEIRAMENGAMRGSVGDVSRLRPHTIRRALSGTGGFLTALHDDDGAQTGAWVYTLPDNNAAELHVTLIVTPANCGKQVQLRSLISGPDAPRRGDRMILTLPPCKAIGERIALAGLVPDLGS